MSLILSTCISLSGGLSIGPWCDGALPPSSAPPLSPSSHTPYLGSQGCVPGYFGCSWARAPADEAPHLRTHSERPQTPTHPPCTRRSRPDLRRRCKPCDGCRWRSSRQGTRCSSDAPPRPRRGLRGRPCTPGRPLCPDTGHPGMLRAVSQVARCMPKDQGGPFQCGQCPVRRCGVCCIC